MSADDDELVDAAMVAAQAIVGLIATSVLELEDRVTLTQLRTLVLVASRGPLNLNALADGLGVHPSNATRICDRLVRAGLLERQASAEDRRHLVLRLSGDGRALLDQLRSRRRDAVSHALAEVQPTDRGPMASALRTLAEGLGERYDESLGKLGWVPRER